MELQTSIDHLENFAAACGVPVVRNSLVAGVLGRVEEQRIVLRMGLSLEQELLTLVHELTHLIVHCHARPPIDRTVCEYEAEAVERWVGGVLQAISPADDAGEAALTDDLLASSVVRVRFAAHTLVAVARGSLSVVGTKSLEAQPAVQVDATAGEEIVFDDELHGVRNFVRLAEPL
jgi:hypothetical protein